MCLSVDLTLSLSFTLAEMKAVWCVSRPASLGSELQSLDTLIRKFEAQQVKDTEPNLQLTLIRHLIKMAPKSLFSVRSNDKRSREEGKD